MQYSAILDSLFIHAMWKKIFIGFVIVAVVLIGYNLYLLATTKNHSPEDVAGYSKEGINLSIAYCKPYKKGRLIFGEASEGALVPYGQVWRTGANEATEITTNKDIYLQDSLLKAGTYSLYTIPGPDQWILAINSKTDYWGRTIAGSPFEPELDVFRVAGKVTPLSEELEQFTINFSEVDSSLFLNLMWDQTKVSFKITHQ